MNEDRLLIKLTQSQVSSYEVVLKLLRRVYDAEMRKQENRGHQKELVLCLWATTIAFVGLLSCEITRAIIEANHFMQLNIVKEVVKLFEAVVIQRITI
jgi:hypothetical protein